MASAEHNAMKLLYSVIPEMIAEPIGWGPFQDHPEAYYFVSRFCEMSDDIPDLSDFPALLAELHKRGVSPDGMFGYAEVTFGGRNPQYFAPGDNWEKCFSNGLARCFDAEEETHGPDEELHQLREAIMALVIPRLLRPLETEGRKLTPRLVHGDLWDGNASVDVNTGNPMIFDPTPLYAHHEYEMAPWWPPRHKMTDAYIAEYIKHFPVSEPANDWKDRGLLYSLRFDMHASSLYTGNPRFRYIAMDTMRDLVKKYPLGYEGYANEKGLSNKSRETDYSHSHLPETRDTVAGAKV